MNLSQSYILSRIAVSFFADLLLLSCANYDNPVIDTAQGNFDISCSLDFEMKDSFNQIFELPDSLKETTPITLEITDIQSKATTSWPDISDFSTDNYFQPGDYKISAHSESKSGIINFYCDTIVKLYSQRTVRLNLNLRPQESWIDNSLKNESKFSLDKVCYHSLLTGSTDSVTDINSSAFVTSGKTEVIAQISNNNDRIIFLTLENPISTESGVRYNLSTILTDNQLTLSEINGQNLSSININDRIFECQPPVINTIGFSSSEPIVATEGITLSHPVSFSIQSESPLKHIYLGVISPLINLLNGSKDPFELDLLNPTAEQEEILNQYSLYISLNEDKTQATIDFKESIEGLASIISAKSEFFISAVDNLGLVSNQKSLIVDTESVSFDVIDVTDAEIGENITTVSMIPSRSGIEINDIEFISETGKKCPILSHDFSGNKLTVELSIPEGINPEKIDLNFMGLRRTMFTVKRSVPDYTIFPDGYATSLRLKIVGHTDKVSKALTRLLKFNIDNSAASVAERDTTTCSIVINGLKPKTNYIVHSWIKDANQSQKYKVTTEEALPVPEGDFEDVDPIIQYKHLPSGGRYALTSLDLINRQNYVDVTVYWTKKYWASINSRTFCTDAKLKNTWYMQPSTEIAWEGASGSKSMMIRSVGWDMEGEPIKDWVPEPGETQTKYSQTIPNVRHHSAGRLFLGKYSFNPSTGIETVNEGVEFTSRPSSLNGFYKYIADPTHTADQGFVKVELVRRDNLMEETVVADGSLLLGPCPDFKSFNVVLKYYRQDLHPTHLKVLFLSSREAADDPTDDVNVPVTPNPEKGAFIGSTLWIDNLSFTY